MSTEASSLVFGVRTSEAVANLAQLRSELEKTIMSFSRLSAKGGTAVTMSGGEMTAALKTLERELEVTSRKMEGTNKASVAMRRSFGEASVGIRHSLSATTAEIDKLNATISKAASDPSTALGRAKQLDQYARAVSAQMSNEAMRFKELQQAKELASKQFSAQARNDLASLERAQSTSRAKELASLRADILARSELQRSAATQARVDLASLERAQATSRAKELAALRADIIARNELRSDSSKQARNDLASLERAQATSRAKELASLRADIVARSEMQRSASETVNRIREQQKNLALRYDAMELTSRIRTLEAMKRLSESGASSATIARRYGVRALSDMGNLQGMRDQVAELRRVAISERDLAKARESGVNSINNSSRAMAGNIRSMRDAHDVARGLAGSLGALWMTWGSVLPLVTGAAIGSVARSSYQVGKDVEYRLAMLEALGNRQVNVDEMMPAVHGSMKTPLDAAKGLQELAQAGLDTNQALAVLTPTLRLATLGEMEVADAALTTTAALSTFKLRMDEATRVGDVFAKGAAVSNTNVAGIAEAMKQAGAGAAAYGVTLEETTAQIAILAQNGIRGSAAGTAIKNSMKELYAPTKKAQTAMKEIGLQIYDDSGNARNYIDILNDLRGTYLSLNEENRNKLLGSMFNERSRRGIQIFMKDLTELKTIQKDLADSSGFLAEANDKLLDTVEGASNRMRSVLEQAYVRGFEAVKPQVRQTIESLEQMFSSEGFLNTVQIVGRVFAGLTSAATDNAQTIAVLAGGYMVLRTGMAAAAASISLYTSASLLMDATSKRKTVQIGLETAALTANTTATTANAVAAGASVTRVTAALTVLTRMVPVINMATLALTLGAAAWYAFGNRTSEASRIADGAVGNINRLTGSIISQNEQLKENIRLAKLSAGGTVLSQVNADNMATAERTLAELKMQRDYKLVDIRNAPSEAAKTMGAVSSTTLVRKLREEVGELDAKIAEAEKMVSDAKRARSELDVNKAELENLQRRQDAMSRLNALADEGDYLPKGHANLTFSSRAKQLAEDLEAGKVTVDQALNSYKEWRKEIANNLGEVNLPTSGGGGSDSLEFRSSSANLQQELANQKTLLMGMRDFQLRLLKKEQEEGVHTTAEAAAQREKIWSKYYAEYEAIAIATSSRINSLEKGSARMKELAADKIREQIAQEKRVAAQEQEITLLQERMELESQARTIVRQADVESAAIKRKLDEDERKRREDILKLTMPEWEVVAMEARNTVQDTYNKLLERQQKLMDENIRKNPEFMGTDAGKALAASMEKLKLDSASRAQQAGETASQALIQSQSVFAGYERGLKALADQGMRTGDVVANSLTSAFNSVGQKVGEIVTTGEFKMKSFLASLASSISQMYAQQAVAQFLGWAVSMIPGAIGGGAGAGASGGTMYGLRRTFAQGGAFTQAGITRFASGGAFTNQVTTGTTIAPMAMFGEAGPEAIMPLTRLPGGDLGVKAMPSGMNGGANIQVNTNVYVTGDGQARSETTGNSDAVKQMAGEIESVVKRVVTKEMGQGGSIREFVARSR